MKSEERALRLNMNRKADDNNLASDGRSRFQWAAHQLERWWLLFALALVFTFLMMRNCVFPLGALLFTEGVEGQDCYQMVWNLWHTAESVSRLQNPYETLMLFYPLGANLSQHTLAAGFVPITLIVKLISGGDAMYPFYTYRIIVLLSFTLILFASFLFLRRAGFSFWASLIPSVAYAFSHFFMLHILHLNHLAAFFIPLTALAALRIYQKPNMARALTLALVAALSLYFTEFALYIYMGLACFLLIISFFKDERRKLSETLSHLGFVRMLAAATLFLLVIAPYLYFFLKANSLKPGPAEASYFSSNLAGFFIPTPERTPLYGQPFSALDARMISMRGYEIFIGFPPLIFAVAGFLKSERRLARVSVIIALIFFILSLGPTLKIFQADTGLPLPYALLMHIPPFDAGRTPVRFVVMGLFFWMIGAAGGFEWAGEIFARRFSARWNMALMAVFFVWTVAEVYQPAARQQPFVPPRGVERTIPGAVLNLPINRADGYAEMLQIFHHRPIATGFLARISRAQFEQLNELERVFNKGGPAFCEAMRAKGIRNIIIAPQNIAAQMPSLIPLELSSCDINVIDLRTDDNRTSTDAALAVAHEEPPSFPVLPFGKIVDLREPESDQYVWYGWSVREPALRWTNGVRASLVFSLEHTRASLLEIRMGAFVLADKHPLERVTVELNGEKVAEMELKDYAPQVYSINLPAALVKEKNVLELKLPDAESPAALGVSADARALGVYVEWLRLKDKS